MIENIEMQPKNWQDMIVNFFENRISGSQLYQTRQKIKKNKDDLIKLESLSTDNTRYIKKIKELERLKHELINLRITSKNGEIQSWLETTSQKKIEQGKRIVKVTHPLKFSHPTANNEGILVNEVCNRPIITTASLQKKDYDLAHNNGALITVSRFLALRLHKNMIFDEILENKFEFLAGFYQNEEQYARWITGFSNFVEERNIKSINLIKQVYFPIAINDKPYKYHLIAPLFPSSLSQRLYDDISKIKFGKITGDAKKQKNIDKFHAIAVQSYSHLSVIKFGGTKRQNISLLNHERAWKADKNDKDAFGISYLLNAAPPQWQSQLKPPMYQKSFFYDGGLKIKTKDAVDGLRKMLLIFENAGISQKEKNRLQGIQKWVRAIAEDVIDFVELIHTIDAGWSATEKIKLKREHQYLLDPYRSDAEFQSNWQSTDWQMLVLDDFSEWLNWALTKDKKIVGQQPSIDNWHSKKWIEVFEPILREFINELNLNIEKA